MMRPRYYMKRLLRIFRFELLGGAAFSLIVSLLLWLGSYGYACRYHHNFIKSSESMLQCRHFTCTFGLGRVRVRYAFMRLVPQVPTGNPTRPREVHALQRRQQVAQSQWKAQTAFLVAQLQAEHRFEQSP